MNSEAKARRSNLPSAARVASEADVKPQRNAEGLTPIRSSSLLFSLICVIVWL